MSRFAGRVVVCLAGRVAVSVRAVSVRNECTAGLPGRLGLVGFDGVVAS